MKKFIVITIILIIPFVIVFLLYQEINIFLIFNDFSGLLDKDEIESVLNNIINIPNFAFFHLFIYSIFIVFVVSIIYFRHLSQKPNIDFTYGYPDFIRSPPTL